MKPLSGLDATFLYAETPTTPMNVIATLVVDGRVESEALIARVHDRLPHLLPFRRRLVEIPLGLDHPAWIEESDVDVRGHISRVSAPAPGDDRALESVVGRVAGRRLDRTRPLWEIVVVDGLSGHRTALVVKAHHAALDGVSGAAVLLHLFDRPNEDIGEAVPAPVPRSRVSEPGPGRLLRYGIRRLRERPRIVQDTLACAGRSVADMAKAHWAPDAPIRDAAWPFQAPACRFDGPLSTHRSVAYSRTPLEQVHRIRGAFGGTVNDVVLTACTRALQGELVERGALPRFPLVAAVPVSTRRVDDPLGGNRISAFLTHLPVQHEDPLYQLSDVMRSTRRAKRVHSALGPETLGALAELMLPGATRKVFETYGRWRLAASHRPLLNVVISNVPGPPFPLALFGQPVDALHPHGPLMEGVGLNITVMSYAGSIDFGILACAERVPEAHRMANRLAEAMEELAKLADAALPEVSPLARDVA